MDKGLSPFFIFTPCMLYTTAGGQEVRLQTLDLAHLHRVTNYDDRIILLGSAGMR